MSQDVVSELQGRLPNAVRLGVIVRSLRKLAAAIAGRHGFNALVDVAGSRGRAGAPSRIR